MQWIKLTKDNFPKSKMVFAAIPGLGIFHYAEIFMKPQFDDLFFISHRVTFLSNLTDQIVTHFIDPNTIPYDEL